MLIQDAFTKWKTGASGTRIVCSHERSALTGKSKLSHAVNEAQIRLDDEFGSPS